MKYLLIAVVCLTLLVIVTPYLIRENGRQITKRPVPQVGALTQEIPKQAEQSAPENLARQEEPAASVKPVETPEASTKPENIKPLEVQPPPEAPQAGTTALQKPAALQATSGSQAAAPATASSAQPAPSAEAPPKDLFPKTKAPSEAPVTAAQEKQVKTKAKFAAPAPVAARPKRASHPPVLSRTGSEPAHVGQESAPPVMNRDFAVQVGTIFKDRSQAQSLWNSLKAKGYQPVVRPTARGGGYLVTTRPGSLSRAYTFKEQMRVQGLTDTKVINGD